MALRELHLFAGCGGGILGGLRLGHVPVCAVEIEPYPRSVLLQRQLDGFLPPFPIWDDVRTFAGLPWRGRVDVVAGGFPCQGISAAGKGDGLDDPRSGLWSEFARIVSEVQPSFCFIENSPLLRTRGLGTVLRDLASMGYDARWGVVSASEAGAPHRRERLWILAHAQNCGDVWRDRLVGETQEGRWPGASKAYGSREWWKAEPLLDRVADGIPNRIHRLRAIGNAQVPSCVEVAWKALSL